jgi:general secretion pathway protein C
MKPSWVARRSLAARLGGGAVGLIRPGAEAVLLAGVAIGCAQIGWRIVSPDSAEVVFVDGGNFPVETSLVSEPRSPFAPFGAGDDSGLTPHADVSGIRLVGVRMSSRPESSGAVLILGDGLQRSFLVGYEIAEGVRLEEVASNHIVVSIGDQHESLMLERAAPAAPSLALALMGVPQEMPANQPVQMASAADASARAVSLPLGPSGDVASWLMSTAGQVEMRGGAAYGWRAASALPEAGVQAGDLIVSVNGVGPNDGQAKLLAAARGAIALVVERRSGERVRLSLSSGISP